MVRIRKPVVAHSTMNMLEEFPREKDGVLYVRQSSIVQVQQNIHSYEMQTDKFIEHFRALGCTGRITVVADDEGLSGTLDIHDRPGLTKVKKMILEHKVGWVGAVHVNRLTRDPWLITPALIMKLCYESEVWIATLRMNFNFKDSYAQRVFMLEAEESAKHLEWMKTILGGAKNAASEKGFYDGRFLVPGFIVNRSDLKKKKYIVYEPHAEIIKWLYQEFLRLGGNFARLCREVDGMAYLFPPFEPWVDSLNTGKILTRKLEDGPYVGYYKPGRTGLLTLLTNPVYIGWWLPITGGVIEGNHDAIVEKDLFLFAYELLSPTNIAGERVKPHRATGSTSAEAVLRDVLKKKHIYVHTRPASKPCYESVNIGPLLHTSNFSLLVPLLDTPFLERLRDRLDSTPVPVLRAWVDHIQEQEQQAEGKQQTIEQEIATATRQMKAINDRLTDEENPPSKGQVKDYNERYAKLEEKKALLEIALKDTSAQEAEHKLKFDIFSLLPAIKEHWEALDFATLLILTNALVEDAEVEQVSESWMRLTVVWAIEDWGIEEVRLRRASSKSGEWTPVEEDYIRSAYSWESSDTMMQNLPHRTWSAIRYQANTLGVPRSRHIKMTTVRDPYITWNDLQVWGGDWESAAGHGPLLWTPKNEYRPAPRGIFRDTLYQHILTVLRSVLASEDL